MRALILALLTFCAVPPDGKWHRCFAWFPVSVDAYDMSEIKDGKLRYPVWLRAVDARFERWIDDDDSRTPREAWRYRLAK